MDRVTDCAIPLRLSITTIIIMSLVLIVPKIDAANINSRELNNDDDGSDEKHLVNITRHYEGDIIFIKDTPSNCNENMCLELSGGSATLYHEPKSASKIPPNKCKCQCLSHLKTYREDEGFCVDTIRECSLVPFVSSTTALDTAEKIPSVFLPLQGQIIYPSKELFFSEEYGEKKCVVMTANYLSSSGWIDNKNFFHSNEVPFRLFTDKNRTFLQWSGDTTHRSLLQGRLILLRISCMDISSEFQRNTYTPCVSFRVTGSLLKHKTNITEVQFALGPSDKEKESLTTNEYVIIAITSFCLGLMYIASVFLYIYLKKKKDQRNSGASSETGDKNFSRGDPDLHTSRSSYRRNSSLAPSIEFIDNPEANVIKSNPLMKHFMSFNENSAFVSDSSDAESIIHKDSGAGSAADQFGMTHDSKNYMNHNSSQEQSECLPEEDVSITEDGEKPDANRSFQNGTTRRKLYFNPAYFEPELLAQPPPAALEFLSKIREVISMAKNKMAAKRFQPVLNFIPEEGSHASGSEIYSPGTLKSRNSTISSRRNSSKADCAGCPGCESGKKVTVGGLTPQQQQQSLKNCKNCGDKQKSIQKWLENVSNATNELSDCSIGSVSNKKDDKRPLISLPILQEDSDAINVAGSDTSSYKKVKKEEIAIVKGFVKEKNIFVQRDRGASEEPENGDSIPKIISHSLKKNIKEMIYSQNFVRDKVSAFESKRVEVKKFDAAAHEIYNNPKFNMDQDTDTLPPRPPYSSVMKKKQEVLDQYSNPSKRPIVVINGKYETSNKSLNNQIPDMIYEAIEMERKNKPINYQSPTPDYSSEYEMTKFSKKYDNVSFAPFVPTPDYHTYGKNTLRSLKQYQPDSPIYSRKSPAYLVVDYETDSLERLNTYKRNRTPVSTPTSRSDFSSQPSPSALPMEEEVEIRNALYDREEGFRKDSDTIKKEREIDIQMRKTKIKYNTPNEGSMTIELEGISPDENDDASSTNSDEFEPDTLDRHAKINKTVLEKYKIERSYVASTYSSNNNNLSVEEKSETLDDMGRILTLEVRHSKRQRNTGEASLKKLPTGQTKHPPQPTISAPSPIPPPDVISSNIKQPFKKHQQSPKHEDEVHLIPTKKQLQQSLENSIATRKTNQQPQQQQQQHIIDAHDYKKSQISAPILTTIESAVADKKVSKTLRGDFLKMDLLSLDTNYHQNKINREYQPSLIKTIYHVELPSPPKLSEKEELYSENGKKTKDFKNAWKRFMGIASGKVLSNNNNAVGGKKYDSDEDEVGADKSASASEIKQGKVKDLIKKLNVVQHVDNCKQLKEYDSGYLSAESNHNDNSLTEVITTKSDNSSDKSVKNIVKTRPPVPPPPIPVKSNLQKKNNCKTNNLSVSLLSTNHYMNSEDLVNINIYSSDDEPNSSAESEDDERNADTCEDVGADSDFSFVN